MSDDSDRLDRLEAVVGRLVDTVARFHDEFVEIARELRDLARTNAADHAEYRQDVDRLYRAWPDHLRDSHGRTQP